MITSPMHFTSKRKVYLWIDSQKLFKTNETRALLQMHQNSSNRLNKTANAKTTDHIINP